MSLRLSKIDRVVAKAYKLGFEIDETSIQICKGPKVKQGVSMCWEAMALRHDTRISLGSEYTFTDLAKSDFTIEKADRDTPIYGQYVMHIPVKLTAGQKALIAKHGTVAEFTAGVWDCAGEISVEEAQAAISKYREEFRKA